MQAKICDKFKVRGYPTIMLGTPADFAAVALDKLTTVEAAKRSLEGIKAFVSKQLDV